ncbi:MAG: hypothetical protein C3F02_04680 [Parcubacteria group bacterium]|nr:MAG: hypothetical protein C3F02_04680 [Parcubacteria group bacterium]
MKKVLVLTHEYYPHRGGVARYCYSLFRHFDMSDYLVISDHPEIKTTDNIRHWRLKSHWLWPTWLITFFKLRRILREEKIGLIFTPNILPLGSLAYCLYLFDKIPYVISLHGLDIRLALRHKAWLTKLILARASLILTNSNNTKEVISYFNLPEEKLQIFYPSLDLELKVEDQHLQYLRRKYELEPDDKILLTVGRLNKRKGQDLVLKAIAQLCDLKIKYFIVGHGDLKAELEGLIKNYNLTGKVFILESVADEEKVYYYNLADIFVLPNRNDDVDVEGFGIVFLEAAACKLAIIAGNSGGVAEIWENNVNALLIDNEDVKQLAAAVRKLLLDNEFRIKLAEAARRRFEQFASSEQQSNRLKGLLAKIV